MTRSCFPYPGSKARYADWVKGHFPAHRLYVEVFGGSAGVLFNKTPSRVEVYNDLDGDLVQFFEVLRDRPGDLREWLSRVPFAQPTYDVWVDAYYDGERPDDPIERAGRFYFLRYAQFGARIDGRANFKRSKDTSYADLFRRKVDRLDDFAERLRGVTIEEMDWTTVLDKYDTEDTLFYCDPPYVNPGDDLYTHEGEFDHAGFVDALDSLDGYWVVSYAKLPDGLDGHIVEKGTTGRMGRGTSKDRGSGRTERLVMNYDPAKEPSRGNTQPANEW